GGRRPSRGPLVRRAQPRGRRLRAPRRRSSIRLVLRGAVLGLRLRGGPRDPPLPLHGRVGTGPEEPDVAGGGLDRRRAPLDVVGPFRCRGPRFPEWIRGDRRLRDRTRDPTPAAVGLASGFRERRRIRTARPPDCAHSRDRRRGRVPALPCRQPRSSGAPPIVLLVAMTHPGRRTL